MSKRTFTIGPETSIDLWVRIEIDTEKMTPALAAEINAYLCDGNELLLRDTGDPTICICEPSRGRVHTGGDPVCAVALRAASLFLTWLSDPRGLKDPTLLPPIFARRLSLQAGWPVDHGIRLREWETPDLDALEVVEATR